MYEKVTEEQNDGADGHREVLEKYDAESRFRVFTNKNITILISVIAVGFALYHLYTSALGAPATLKHRSIHVRSEEHTSELQSRGHLVCRLLLEKKNTNK